MKIIEAYLLTYDYIDNYYKKTKSGIVGVLLSWMEMLDDDDWSKGPGEWGKWMYDVIEDIKKGVPVVDLGIIKEEYRTVDPATWEDWMDVAGKYIKDNTIDKEDVLQITIDFLVFHKEEFDYEFDDAIEYFEKIKANK